MCVLERDNEDLLRIVSGCSGHSVRGERQGAVVGRCSAADNQGRRQACAGGLGLRSRRAAEQRYARSAGDDGAPAAAPGVGADAQTKGVFGPPVTWPIIAIHAVLLPDGRVMNFGTDEKGRQGGQFVYDVWNPTLGTDTAAHTVLPNTTSTDIFCAGQSVFATSGEVLITAGDLTINGQRNFGNDRTTIFRPQTNAIMTDAPMLYARWYPTVVALPTGEMLVLGGREDMMVPTLAPTPKVFTQNVGWRTLWGATSGAAFGNVSANWFYPEAFVAPNGKVFVLGNGGEMFYLDPAGNGTITQLTEQTLWGDHALPSVMFATGRILSVRSNRKVVVVDLNGPEPAITPTADINQLHIWSSGTVLADARSW
jgi:hypothetical protein